MKPYTNTIFISLLLISLWIPLAKAYPEININIQTQPSFSAGEEMFFNYTLISRKQEIITYIPYIDCPQALAPFSDERTIMLKKDTPFKDTYYGTLISRYTEPQICTAYIEIIAPVQKWVEKRVKIATYPSFEIDVFVCKDKACKNKSQVFIQGETAYFDYKSDIADLEIKSNITSPNNDTIEIDLTKGFLFSNTGKYNLKIQVKKENYKTNKQNIEILVLKKKPTVIDIRICNRNNHCESKENYRNCPQDCPSGSEDNYCDKVGDDICDPDCLPNEDVDCNKKFNYYFYVALVILLLILTGLYIKNRQKGIHH